MKRVLSFTLNDDPVEVVVKDNMTLLDLLRDKLGLTGTKKGCEQGECGACTVMLDGLPVNSCCTLAVECEGRSVVTVEGLILNPSFRDDRLPTALDMPKMRTFYDFTPDDEGPLGAKEAGEGSAAPVAPAIANAVNMACGIYLTELPLDPEHLWRAMRGMKDDRNPNHMPEDDEVRERYMHPDD